MSTLKLLFLQISQAEELISKARFNNYSDNNKKEYHQLLTKLFYKIKKSVTADITEEKIFDKKKHLDFIFQSLSFLKDSTLNSIPYEVVACLNAAMGDWINKEDFIIVTGLQNELYSFSFDIRYSKNDLLYKSLETNYGIKFNKKLVQINLPIALSKDYLSSVALYHELGHFVDQQFSITLVTTQIILQRLNDDQRKELYYLFPYLETKPPGADKILLNHVGEYFCDLFAAQYIGENLCYYLEFATSKQSVFFHSHPSTIHRSQFISDYLSGKSNLLLNLFHTVVSSLTGKKICQRFARIDSIDFYRMIPYQIKSSEELHGIIGYGWTVWLSDFMKFQEVNGQKILIENEKVYQIINNLVEKSIGNFIVTNRWENAKKRSSKNVKD